MKTLNLILKADPDGSLHVPLPPELRNETLRIEANLEVVSTVEPDPVGGNTQGWTDWLKEHGPIGDDAAEEMLRAIEEAFERIDHDDWK